MVDLSFEKRSHRALGLATPHTEDAALVNPIRTALTACACAACCATGWTLTPNGVRPCPACQRDLFTPEPNPAAQKLAHCVQFRFEKGSALDPDALGLARLLTLFSTAAPCPGPALMAYARWTHRYFSERIELLRDEWLLPVGSRKRSPMGYWLIVTADDYLSWQRENNRAALTVLTRNAKLFRHNWPELAGQDKLAFAREIERELEEWF